MRISRIVFVLACLTMGVAHADEYSDTLALFSSSPTTQPFFDSAYGYAVFPTIGKGGIGIGAAHGAGKVYKQGKLIGKTRMSQVSVGFQLGAQAYSQMIFFQDQRALSEFTSGNFEFSAGASAIAITASAQAATSTAGSSASTGSHALTTKQLGANYHKGMAVLTVAKGGLMYEAVLAGQKYSYSANK